MCLSIEVHTPDHVLKKGEYLNHEWVVVHNGMGFRCGYIRVDKGHPWYGKDYDDFACDVHGGLTFADHDVACGKGKADNGYWLGFDCGHWDDGYDMSLPFENERVKERFKDVCKGTIKTTEYVEAQCKQLIEQAVDAIGVVQ